MPVENLAARAVLQELLGDAELVQWRREPGVAQGELDLRADAADDDVVLDDRDAARAAAARVTRSALTGSAQTGSTTRTRTPSAVSFSAAVTAVVDHRADADEQQVDVAVVGLGEHVDRAGGAHGDDGVTDRSLGETDHRRGVGDVDGGAHGARDLLGVARGCEVQPGHDAADRHVPHAVVRGAVGAGDARAVEHDGDAGLVHGAVHQQLVERAVEEGRVDGDDGVQPGERQAGRHGERVLLGDADVEGALGEVLAEVLEPDRDHHRGGDRDDVGAVGADAHHLVAELVGPAATDDLERKARSRG